jgi:hypothetical protein
MGNFSANKRKVNFPGIENFLLQELKKNYKIQKWKNIRIGQTCECSSGTINAKQHKSGTPLQPKFVVFKNTKK